MQPHEGLPHRRIVGHRRGAGAALRGPRRDARAVRAARRCELARVAAALARRDGRRPTPATSATPRRCAAAARRFHRAPRRARRRHRQCRRVARHADRARARTSPAFRAVFDTNVIGMVQHVPAVRRGRCARARRGTLVGIASVAGFRGLPGLRRVLGVEGGGDHLSREPARRDARQRRRGRHDLPGLRRDAADRAQSLPDAVPDARRRRRGAKIARAIARRKRFYVLPWPMALVGPRCCGLLPRRSTTRAFAGARRASRGAAAIRPRRSTPRECATRVSARPRDLQGATGRASRIRGAGARRASRAACRASPNCCSRSDLGERVVARTGFCIHPRDARAPRAEDRRHQGSGPRARCARSRRRISSSTSTRTGARCVDAARAFVPHVIVTHPLAPDDNPRLYALFGAIFDRDAAAARAGARVRRGAGFARSTPSPRCRASACSTSSGASRG